MNVRSLVAVGFLSALAAVGMVNASSSAAEDSNQSGLIEERVGHGGSIFYSKTPATRSSHCEAMAKGALVEERIGHVPDRVIVSASRSPKSAAGA